MTSALRFPLAVGALALAVHAQTPAPRSQTPFRSGTDLVQVDVTVLDGRRRPVRGLTAADFTILEDGHVREIQAFSEIELAGNAGPAEAEWTTQVPSDVSTNAVAQEQGRLIIVLMDRSIPVGEPTATARRIATGIVNGMGSRDLAAVVSTSNGAVHNFTGDRARLLRTLARGDASTDISDEAKEIESRVFALTGRTWTALNDPRCQCGLCVLEAITRTADAVQSSSRRKLLFFIGSDLLLHSAGAPGEARQDVGCERRLEDAREAMLAALDRANLTVHSLDPLGMSNLNPITRASSTLGAGAAVSRGNASAAMSNLQRQGNLEVLPERTGGRAVLNTNAPEGSVPALFRESDSYYLIGFRPDDKSRDGQYHPITVKALRPGLKVRARSGYSIPLRTGPAGPSSANAPIAGPVRDALTGLLPAAAIPISLSAATFAGTDPRQAAVILTVGLGAAAFGTPPASAPIELVASAFDQSGQPRAVARQSLTLTSSANHAALPREFDAQSRLDLPPGEYEIRVAVAGPAGAASVFRSVTVLPFAAAPLSLSNIVVAAGADSPISGADGLSRLLPVRPTARRTFRSGESFVALFRIYQGTAREAPLESVQVRFAITDAAGKRVGASAQTLEAAQFARGRSADHFVKLPGTLAPGDYLLTVETTLGSRTAGRAMRFTVEP